MWSCVTWAGERLRRFGFSDESEQVRSRDPALLIGPQITDKPESAQKHWYHTSLGLQKTLQNRKQPRQ